MNDNHWYPRDPQRYLTDTAWCDHATEVAHVRLIDTYYALGRPIKDEPSRVKNIGKIPDADYARVRGNLFELGWRVEDGFWRHKRIEETLAEMDAERRSKIKASASGVRRRRELGQLPQVEPPIQPAVEPQVEPEDASKTNQRRTQPQPQLQLQLQPQPQPQLQPQLQLQPQPQPQPHGLHSMQVELPVGFPQTVDEAKVAAMFVGCPEDFAADEWNRAMSRGGRDAKNVEIRSWRHFLSSAWKFQQNRNAKGKPDGNNQNPRPNRNAGTHNDEITDAERLARRGKVR